MMTYTRTLTFCCIAVLLVFVSTTSAYWKKEAPPPSSEPIDIEYTTFSLSPYITGGLLTGKAADLIEETFRQAVYGAGMRLEYMVNPVVRLDGGIEMLFAQVYDNSLAKGHGFSYSAGTIIMFTPHNRSSFYGRGTIGWASLNASNISKSLGTHLFTRIALGQAYYSSPTRTVRFELYYNIIRTDNIGSYPYVGNINFNTTHVGILLGMSFGL